MFQIDHAFLDEVGLGSMRGRDRAAFLEHLQQEYELRVGTALSDSLGDDELDQFEGFIDGDLRVIGDWLEANDPNFMSTPEFLKLESAMTDESDIEAVIIEYTSIAWLRMHRPDYREVIERIYHELKTEIRSNRIALIGS